MWQKCPVCSGTGSSFSPGFQQSGLCNTCHGHGIISELNGAPPTWAKVQTTTGVNIFPKISEEQKREEIADILKRTNDLTKKP